VFLVDRFSLGVYSSLLALYRSLLGVYRSLSGVYRSLFLLVGNLSWSINLRHDKDSLLGVYRLFRVYIGFFWVYIGLFYGLLVIFCCRPICRYDNEQVRLG